MSSKASKTAALRKLQMDRCKSKSAALDDYEDDVDDDVYTTMTEQEYEQVVQARRQRDDFVVDDDGLGYVDDGEEHVFDNQDDEAAAAAGGSKKQKTSSAALTAHALQQARKQRAAAVTSGNNDEASAKNRSMWDFVNKAPSIATASSSNDAAAAIGLSSNAASSNKNKRSLDALLSELDQDDATDATFASNRRRSHLGSRGGRHAKRPAPKSSRSSASRSTVSPSRRQQQQQQQQQQVDDEDANFAPNNNHDYHDDDDDNVNPFGDDDDQMQVDSTKEAPTSTTKSVRFADSDDTETLPAKSESAKDMTNQDVEEPAAKAPRRLLARPKLTLSEPARLALERKQQAEASKSELESTIGSASSHASNMLHQSVTLPTELSMSSSSSVSSSSHSSQVDFEKLLTKTTTTAPSDAGDETTEESQYIDFFWMDLAERKNGDILLFGKVPLTPNASKYVSACALVTGNVRNLFALPRNPETMLNVHQEINTLLHSSILLPRKPGVSWAGKPVVRNYAFEDTDIPREPTKYLKIVYDAKYPVPSEEVCQNGGEHFSKILNAGASVRETFILKRKLMGPCWLRITNPRASQAPLSWCQAELHVDSPKQIVRLDLVKQNEGSSGGPPRPPPPVVTMSLKLHTMVHPKTHQSEIVAVAAVCHKHVLLDSSTSDPSPRDVAHLTLIRPLPMVAVNDETTAPGHMVSSKPSLGVAQFPRDLDREIQTNMPHLKRETNERALISRLLVQIGQWDPDVIVAHNAWGFEMEVLLNRCIEHKLKSVWSKVGRRRCSDLPNKSHFASRRDIVIMEAMAGRLLCDTYLSAQENLRETTYSLTSLAATQLKFSRQDIEPADTPQWFESSKAIVQLAARTLVDAQLVQRLVFKLQTLPLSKQLTCVAGNIWSHTLKSNRAERTEYLLLHEFHRLKFLAPEKRRGGKKALESNKAKYSGGLVLEPKKGLYDSYILLLDFNSLYPSIIQEYNLCFTTIDWSKFTGSIVEEGEQAGKGELPPLPDSDEERGVLPRVIKSLVDRRRAVKRFMKEEKDPDKKEELNIRQTALKLTANSMYGCLGFSNSRFYAQPIAALVTAMGRETLQRTVDIAQHTVGLDVIYGDTDSIMINTRLTGDGDLKQVKKLGEQVKQEVNKLYNTLELEIDGVFRPMLLLKKKKYAANTVEELPNGEIKYGQELKGLDLVRRDWCVQSRDTGRYVTEQILSGQDSEVVFQNIFTHLEEIAAKMRSGELAIEKYVITKGLSKHPNEYPDAKAQPHVQVAKMMLANNRAVNKGDHIPYIITAPLQQEGDDVNAKALPAAERARHPEEVARSDGALKPDVEWYLTQQILPPISRLCEPIEACSLDILADKLGLDGKRYNQQNGQRCTIDDDELINYVPASFLPDKERFKDVTKLEIYCGACNEKNCISGVFDLIRDASTGVETVVSGLCCVNPDCPRPLLWGHATHLDLFARIQNALTVWVRGLTIRYYQGVMQCSEPGCSLVTRQMSVAGGGCLRRGCTGRLNAVQSEREIHTHLKYLESLFDVNHACDQLEDAKKFGRKVDLLKTIPSQDKVLFDELHSVAKDALGSCAFNWISPSFWGGCFQAKQ
ncbi:hypothetical protein MPSEU_000408600 [Mayamaea pseudoterrestris]|nr:hypothetical protein MPSEU_000408600 [Mayamaea pseudoterrestris]